MHGKVELVTDKLNDVVFGSASGHDTDASISDVSAAPGNTWMDALLLLFSEFFVSCNKYDCDS